MSDFSITRKLARITAEMDMKGGFLNQAGARLLNVGLFITAPVDAVKHLGVGIINVPLAPFGSCYNYFEKAHISISIRGVLNHFVEVINHIAFFILAPIGIVSPQFMNKICEELRPVRRKSNSTNTPTKVPEHPPLKNPVPQETPRPPIESARKRFYADCKSQMMNYNSAITDEEARKIAKRVYMDLVKNPVSPLANRITTAVEIPHVKLIASFANRTTIVQTDKLLGKGAYKEAYDGFQFTLQPDSTNALKVNVTAIAVLRFKNRIRKHGNEGEDLATRFQKIKLENDLAEKFSSNNVVKKSEIIFHDGNEWVMVSDKLPFFFENIFPKNALCSESGYDVYPVVPYTAKELIRGLKGVAKGLDHLHQKGYIHRDIKPANMAIQSKRREKGIGKGMVTDLGFLIQKEKKHAHSLTAFYAPPELVDSVDKWKVNSQTAEGDLWALGVSLYQIFHPTHRYPYYGKNDFELRTALSMIKNNPSGFEISLFKDWPHKECNEVQLLQKLIVKLMSIDPSKRGTASEVAADLRAIEYLYKAKESKKSRKSKDV